MMRIAAVLPAFAPLHTISAMRKGDIPARSPAFIAKGATSAVDRMAPGPISAAAAARQKNITGSSLPRPPARRRARRITRSVVPFASAQPNSSVTPTSATGLQ